MTIMFRKRDGSLRSLTATFLLNIKKQLLTGTDIHINEFRSIRLDSIEKITVYFTKTTGRTFYPGEDGLLEEVTNEV